MAYVTVGPLDGADRECHEREDVAYFDCAASHSMMVTTLLSLANS